MDRQDETKYYRNGVEIIWSLRTSSGNDGQTETIFWGSSYAKKKSNRKFLTIAFLFSYGRDFHNVHVN